MAPVSLHSLRSGRLRRLAIPAAGVGLLALVAVWPRLAPAGPEPPDPTPRPVLAGGARQTAPQTVPQRADESGEPGYADGAEPATAPEPRKPKAGKPRDREPKSRRLGARRPNPSRPTAPAAPPARAAPSMPGPVTPLPAPPSPAREFGWP
jgi:hypothetical protein